MLTENLKLELEKQFDETPDYVIGVSYGFKKKQRQNFLIALLQNLIQAFKDCEVFQIFLRRCVVEMN